MKKITKRLTKILCVCAIFTFVNVYSQNVWTGGGFDSNWNNVANWSAAGVPAPTPVNDILITNFGTQPILTEPINLESGRTISILPGAILTVDVGGDLTVNPGAIIGNNGTLVVGAGTVTFKSDATGSGYIDSSTGTFTGDFTVERYVPAKRAFRFLSTPVTTSNNISNNWQQATHITGSGGAANGFDATATNNPSMFTYDNTDETWDAVTNTNGTNLVAGTPYRIMVRGDRSTNLSSNSATPSATTLVSTGTLTEEGSDPTALVLNTDAGGYSLVGNPFQAPVDMSTVNISNVLNTTYWVWDPNLNTRGAYTTVTLPGGVATGGSSANQYLMPGQGAFVQTLAAGAASLQFTQANKDVIISETAVFKTSKKTQGDSMLSLNLYETNALTENETATDGVLIFFDETYSNDNDVYDAAKFSNLDETFATSNDGELLSIERRAIPSETDEIPLSITTYRNSNYTIVAEGSSLEGETAYLVDTYTDEYTEIPDNGTVNYSYNIDENVPASEASDRFKISFAQKSLSASKITVNQIEVYPNPSIGGEIYLQVPQNMDDLEISIYNALGIEVYRSNGVSSGSKATISTDFAANRGVYFVKLSSDGNEVTKKLMIN